MGSETEYNVAHDLVVEGQKIDGGTPLSELEKRGGVWTNKGWITEAIRCGHLVPASEPDAPPQSPAKTDGDEPEHQRDADPPDAAAADEIDDDHADEIDDDHGDSDAGGDPGGPNEESEPVNATNSAIRLAAEHGLDLNEVAGSGVGGKITQPDVKAALEQATAP